MTPTPLSRLERVAVRDAWPGEAQDFTPWLAQPENIQLLGDTVNLELEVERIEANVGPFRADILCKNTADQTWVLIENQFGRTDPSHLGRLITYAAGLEAVTIIWIAESFAEEHRAALDWLNKATTENISFLGIQLELWRISSSPPAPRFHVICRPNDWSDAVSSAARVVELGELTDTNQTYLEYWTALRDELQQRGSPLRPQKPQPQSWYSFAIGRAGFALEAVCTARDRRIRAHLVLSGPLAKQRFNALKVRDEELRTAIGEELDWYPSPKFGFVRVHRPDSDPMDRSQWHEQHAWLTLQLQRLYEVFSPIARNWSDVEVSDAAANVDDGLDLIQQS